MNHPTYKNLPILRPKEIFGVFKTLQVPDAVVAKHAGCTRQSVFRWRKVGTEDIRPALMMRLNEVAYRLLRAAKSNKLPVRTDIRPSTAEWDDALDDASYPVPLLEAAAADVLPNSWLAKFNIQPDSPDVSS